MTEAVFDAAAKQAVLIHGLELAKTLTEQLLTLSLAFLGFSVTFLTEVMKREPTRLALKILATSWLLHLASMIFGLVALGGLAGTLMPVGGLSFWVTSVSDGARLGSGGQLVFFGLGTAVFCAFGWMSLTPPGRKGSK